LNSVKVLLIWFFVRVELLIRVSLIGLSSTFGFIFKGSGIVVFECK
jgi:hypothetical protein